METGVPAEPFLISVLSTFAWSQSSSPAKRKRYFGPLHSSKEVGCQVVQEPLQIESKHWHLSLSNLGWLWPTIPDPVLSGQHRNKWYQLLEEIILPPRELDGRQLPKWFLCYQWTVNVLSDHPRWMFKKNSMEFFLGLDYYLYYFYSGCTATSPWSHVPPEYSTTLWPYHVTWLPKFPCYLYLNPIVCFEVLD